MAILVHIAIISEDQFLIHHIHACFLAYFFEISLSDWGDVEFQNSLNLFFYNGL